MEQSNDATHRVIEVFDWKSLEKKHVKLVPVVMNNGEDVALRVLLHDGSHFALAHAAVPMDTVAQILRLCFDQLCLERFKAMDANGEMTRRAEQLITRSLDQVTRKMEAELHAIAREHLAKAIKAKIDAAVMRLDVTLPAPANGAKA